MNFTKTIITTALLSGALTTFAKDKVEKQPNLLFIFPDQYRINAMSIWADPAYREFLATNVDPVYTPNLDKLAKKGVLFTQAYSINPVCSPYRAMLMTSRYQHENGVNLGNCKAGQPFGLKEDIVTFTDVLAANGYDTAYVGKTHWAKTMPFFDENKNYVGESGQNYANTYDTYIPEGRGRLSNRFWFQVLGDHHRKNLIYSNQSKYVNGKADGEVAYNHEYTPVVEANVVVDYLKNEHNERPKDKPFSLFWAPNPPHSGYSSIEHVEPEVYIKNYKDRSLIDLFVQKNVVDDGSKDAEFAKKCIRFYFTHILSMDREIGKVLDALEASGEADNTIVVFTSDHGEMMGSQGRMGKTVLYRESFIVPMVISYPPKLQHRVEDLRISPLDIMPTILGMLNLADKLPENVRGINYGDAILNNDFTKISKPKNSLFATWYYRGVMTDKYTYGLHMKDDKQSLLFDNEKDPFQLKKLKYSDIPAEDFAELNAQLKARLIESNDPWYKKKIRKDILKY